MNLNTISSQLYLTTVKSKPRLKTVKVLVLVLSLIIHQNLKLHVFLITNRHVVENTKDGKILFHVMEENNQEPSLEKRILSNNS